MCFLWVSRHLGQFISLCHIDAIFGFEDAHNVALRSEIRSLQSLPLSPSPTPLLPLSPVAKIRRLQGDTMILFPSNVLHSICHIVLLRTFFFVTFCLFGSFCRLPIGPCTIHPYMPLIPRDSGVEALPLYTPRGHSHLPRVHGPHYGFYRALSLSTYRPYT